MAAQWKSWVESERVTRDATRDVTRDVTRNDDQTNDISIHILLVLFRATKLLKPQDTRPSKNHEPNSTWVGFRSRKDWDSDDLVAPYGTAL